MVKAMKEAGLSLEQVTDVLGRMDEDRRSKARTGNAKRQAEFRARHPKSNANNGVTCVTGNGFNGVTPRAHVVNTSSFPSVRKNLEDTPTASQCPQGGDETKTRRVRSNRGSRLPDDWRPSEELFSFGISEGLSWAEVSAVSDEFRDYWRGVPGARGTKLDWPATFRNRLREVARKTKPKSRAGPRGGSSGFSDMLDELRGQHGNGTGDIQENRTSSSGPARQSHPADLPESPRGSSGVTYLDFGSQRAHVG